MMYECTVKIETLCSRFYVNISVTGGDINMGSSGEKKNGQFNFLHSMTFFMTFPFDFEERHQI